MSWLSEFLKLFRRPKPPVIVPPSPPPPITWPPPPPIEQPPVPVPPSTGNAMLDAVNEFRRQNGKPPQIFNSCLEWQASQHAVALARNTSLGHSGFRQRAANCGMGAAAENVAWGGVRGATQAVEMWSNSSGHRANMLGDYAEFGGAVINGAAVMIVGTRQTIGARAVRGPAGLLSEANKGYFISGISIE